MKLPSRRSLAILLVPLVLAAIRAELTPQWTSNDERYGATHASWLTCRAGDVNGDGFDDIVMCVPSADGGNGVLEVYFGRDTGLAAAPDQVIAGPDPSFGYAVSRAGDVNDDGYADVVVSDTGYANGQGAIFVYAGAFGGLPADPTWTVVGQGGVFGESVMTAGDVDANPGDEIIVGADGYEDSVDDAATGHVYVYSLVNGQMRLTWDVDGSDYIKLDPAGEYIHNLGFSVSTAGDVNGDGYDDVIVGAPTLSYHGWNNDPRVQSRVYVFHGSATGLSKTCAWFYRRYQEMSWMPNLGQAVSATGDLDNDGYDDVIVGAPGAGVDFVGVNGEVMVFRGGRDGLEMEPWWTMRGPETSYYGIGTSVGAAADFNGDGYRDVIFANTNYVSYLFYGSNAGLSTTANVTVDRRNVFSGGAWWPQTMYAGDVNGDGSDDLLIAATGGDINGGPIPGSRAEIFHGSGVGMGDGHRQITVKALRQELTGGSREIAAGEVVIATTVRLGARVICDDAGSLEIEVRPAGQAFQDAATHTTPPVATGTTATIDITLAPEAGYHWRARVRTTADQVSPWVVFGKAADLEHDIDFSLRTNEAPVGRNAGQRFVPVGGSISDRMPLTLVIDATDGHSDRVEFLVEIRPLGEAFSGHPTHRSGLRPSGAGISLDLSPGSGLFHWQWSLEDEFGAGAGSWTAFGGNGEAAPDFIVSVDGSEGHACGFSAGASSTLLILVGILVAALRRK